ncbi:MAG: ATPase, T2SS/T4P/T4SS family [Erysipelotrichaceae bacterium]
MGNNIFQEVDLGFLEELLNQEDIRDVVCNPDGSIVLTSNEKGTYTLATTIDDIERSRIANQVANKMEKEFNPAFPFLEGEIEKDGYIVRVSAFHPYVSERGTALTLRKVTKENILDEKGMIESKYATQELLDLLKEYVKGGCNILVIGETGSGKTQLVKWMAQFVPNHERIVTIEDSMEFQLPLLYPNKNVLEVRVREGMSYSKVIAKCLRQNLQWLFLQEAREKEVDDLLDGMSAGCKVMTTMHTDESIGVTTRILQMLKLDSSAYISLDHRVHSLVDVVICVKKKEDVGMHRYISSVVEYDYTDMKPNEVIVYEAGNKQVREHSPSMKEKLRRSTL